MTNIRPDHPVQYRLRDYAMGALFERMSHLPANILGKFPTFLALGGQLPRRKTQTVLNTAVQLKEMEVKDGQMVYHYM